MTDRNFDIDAAPRGQLVRKDVMVKGEKQERETLVADKVILATKCGVVTTSYWIPDEARWNMLAAGEQPIAWMLWPSHPSPSSSKGSEGC